MRWLFQSLLLCVIAWSVVMAMVQIVNKYGQNIHIPDSRLPYMYTIIILFILIMRSFKLIQEFESTEKNAARVISLAKTQSLPIPDKVGSKSVHSGTKEDNEYFLKRREYEHKKTRIIVLYTCASVVLFASITSLFFLFFVYDDAPLRKQPVPLLDQILIPVSLAATIILINVKTASYAIESLEKRMFSPQKGENPSYAPEQVNAPRQLEHNFPAEILNGEMQLVCSMSAFVRYCVSKEYYYPYTKKAWAPIDGLIRDTKDKPITAKQLAQSYQDMMSKGTLPS